MLDLRRLGVFREVCRLGSFSEAALALNYSQPAVSHHVARLELEVGTKLLDRSPRGGVATTPAGRALLSHAEILLAQVASAEAELGELIGDRESRVRLGAFATASATVVADAVAGFRAAHRAARLSIVEGEALETLQALANNQIDFAVVFDDPHHPLTVDESKIELRYLYRDPMLLALPARHRLARREVVELSELREDGWIEGEGAETPCSLILMTACEEAGFEPQVAFNSGNYQVVLRLVAAGVGVALVPDLALGTETPGVVMRPLRPRTPYRRIGLAVAAGGYRSAALRSMLDSLEGAFGRYAARQSAGLAVGL
jgi:DNA-binding transcriptional LysR family regulator